MEGEKFTPEDAADWKAPETGSEISNVPEKVLKLGDKEFRPEDTVTVINSNGARETDWTLKSFGAGNAVVVRPNSQGGFDRKVPTIDQFLQWQATTPSGKINFDALPPEVKTNIPSQEEIRRLTGL